MNNHFLTRNKINLDISIRCTLACLKCWRDWHFSKGSAPLGKDMTISEYKKIISFFHNITFCGQISDPVLHPKFTEFLKLGYENNNNIEIRTAVSHKPIKWYLNEAFPANPNATWCFGIDGLPKDSNKYRIRQDGEKLFEIMKLGKEFGIKVIWSCIIMSYNENDIDEIKKIANKNKITLELIKSSRWFKNDNLKPKLSENYSTGVWIPNV